MEWKLAFVSQEVKLKLDRHNFKLKENPPARSYDRWGF